MLSGGTFEEFLKAIYIEMYISGFIKNQRNQIKSLTVKQQSHNLHLGRSFVKWRGVSQGNVTKLYLPCYNAFFMPDDSKTSMSQAQLGTVDGFMTHSYCRLHFEIPLVCLFFNRHM